MTYINGITPHSANLLFLKTANGTGSLSVNDVIDFNTTAIFNNSTITINSNNLVLGPGNYMIDAGLGIDNSADPVTNYAVFNITVDTAAGDSPGSSIQDNKVGVDASVVALSVESGNTKTIRVKVTAVGGTCNVADDYSWIKVMQVL